MRSSPNGLSAVGDATAPTSATSRTTKAPAFQLYAADYLADPRVMAMTWEQRGVYTWLLFTCWNNHGELPSDRAILARMLNIPVKKFEERVWPALASCFELMGNVYTHPHLTEQRAKHDAFRSKQAANGAKGGRPPKGLGYSGLSQTETKKSSSSSSSSLTTLPALALEVVTDGTAAIHVEHAEGFAASKHIVPPPIISNSSELNTWLAPIRTAFEERGARWYPKPDEQLIALHARGIPTERVVRATRIMFDAPGLNSPSPRMLGAQWERWDSTATAAEGWELYKRHELTSYRGDSEYYRARIAKAVKAGAWLSEEEATRELQTVRPVEHLAGPRGHAPRSGQATRHMFACLAYPPAHPPSA